MLIIQAQASIAASSSLLQRHSAAKGGNRLAGQGETAASWIPFVQDAIRQNNVRMVRLCVQDTSNVSRSRYVTAHNFLDSIGGGKEFSFPSALFSFDTSANLQRDVGGGFEQGFPSWKLRPDLRTFGVLPYAPGVARVVADVLDDSDQAIVSAPRQLLRRVLSEFEHEGYRVKGSFEYEFYAQKQTENGLEPAWRGLQCFSETKQAEVEGLIGDILRFLEEMGAGPEVANTEYGSGQFEVSNSPFWNIEISDMAFYYRSSIKEILTQRGYQGNFMSKPFSDMSGSGAHLHHSIYDAEGRNLFYDAASPDGISPFCKFFIGGQLYHARTLTALSNSTVNSYKRLQAYSFAPCTITWGYDNRSTLIRVPPARGENTRIENRLPGADTDPYITLAAVLAAGLDGVRNQIDPTPLFRSGDGYGTDAERLHRSLGEALEHLERDAWAHNTFGDGFLQHFLQLRTAEYDRFLRHVTDWERNEYSDLF